MGIPVVRPPQIRDPDDLYQREARNAIKQLDAIGARKTVVKGIVLGTTATLVAHQLGKLPIGWQIIDSNALVTICRDSTIATTNDTIPLKASAAVTVDIQFW